LQDGTRDGCLVAALGPEPVQEVQLCFPLQAARQMHHSVQEILKYLYDDIQETIRLHSPVHILMHICALPKLARK
jgi:hypothetical protein